MRLIYVDESGINHKRDDKDSFLDGPFIVWGGLAVADSKYFHLERMFIELVNKYFKEVR